MKRIGLYLGFPPEGGGAFQYAQSVFEALASFPPSRYEIVVACSNSAWLHTLEQYNGRFEYLEVHLTYRDLIIGGFLRFGLSLSLWRSIAGFTHRLSQLLITQNCDLWIFPAQDIWTYAIPTTNLGVIHDLMHRYEPRFPEVSSFGLFCRRDRHYRRICQHAQGVLVDSEVGKRQAMDSYDVDADQIYILPFVAPTYIHTKFVPTDFDLRYKLPQKFVFYPAQFWEHKNHIRLLQAMESIRHVLPDLHLVLAGSKKNGYSSVVKEIVRLGLQDQVQILGYVPEGDIPILYRRALAMIMPTFFGPTNIPPLEAMAIGCPMAVSNIYAMPEQVGDAALLFNPLSVSEIAEAILRLATEDELRQKLTEAGKKRAALWGQTQFNNRLLKILEAIDC